MTLIRRLNIINKKAFRSKTKKELRAYHLETISLPPHKQNRKTIKSQQIYFVLNSMTFACKTIIIKA